MVETISLDNMLMLAHDPLGSTQPTPQLSQGVSEEMGVSLHLPFSNRISDDAYEVLNPEQVKTAQLVRMRLADTHVRALMRLMTLPIRAALENATVTVEDDDAAEEAQFIKDMLFLPEAAGGMKTPFRRVVAQMLLALVDGYSCFELVYKMPTDGPLAGKYTLHKIARRPPTTCTFVVDEHGDYNGFRQRATLHGKAIDEWVSPEHSMYFAAQEEENPFYGVSYFLPAFWHYDKKVKVYYLWHLAAQMNAVPGRVGTEPANASADQKRAFRTALNDYGLGSALRLPLGFEFTENSRKIDLGGFEALINHHNSGMSDSVLARRILGEGSSVVDSPLIDSSTGTAPADEMFILQLTGIMGDLEETINSHLIPKFIDWNFDSGRYPHFGFSTLTDEQKAAVRGMFDSLAAAATVNTQPEFLFELEKRIAGELGLDIDYEALEEDFLAEKDLAAAAREAQVMQTRELASGAAHEPQSAEGVPDPHAASPNAVATSGPPLLLSDIARRLLNGDGHDDSE